MARPRNGQCRRAKRKGGLSVTPTNEFLPARPVVWGWESVSAIPASAGRQNRKIFVSLIEKNFWGAPLKNDEKIFLFCSPSGERKHWAGFNPQNPLDFAQNGFGFHPTNTTKVNIEFNFMLEKNEKTKNLKERIARLKGFL